MRINPDTKDALLFATGLLGMIAQLVVWALGIADPSVPLIAAYLTMCGIAAFSTIFGGVPPSDRRDDDYDERPPPPRRKRKARERRDRDGT